MGRSFDWGRKVHKTLMQTLACICSHQLSPSSDRTLLYKMDHYKMDFFYSTKPRKYLPNMNKFCDCLSETKVISVHDSFF